MRFTNKKEKRSGVKFTAVILIGIFVVIMVFGAIIVRKSYEENLKPISSESKTHVITIQSGSTTAEIADTLKTKGLIKSDWAFEWYVRNQQLRDQLKAGTFIIDQNQSVQEIVTVIVDGKEATDLVTILPGRRLDEIKQNFIKAGFNSEEVEAALEPSQYGGHPALTDKPKGANLEGYLYPETFQKTAETSLKDIIMLSLDEMQLRLSADVRQAITKQGWTLHQAIILASLIEGEVSLPEDRVQVAQVFQKRLRERIRLESNATDEYAKLDPQYDTYKVDGLPPGPISNVTETSVTAVAFPAQTDWLYFVSGDDKKTHFSKTFEEHQKLIEKYCTTLCGR